METLKNHDNVKIAETRMKGDKNVYNISSTNMNLN